MNSYSPAEIRAAYPNSAAVERIHIVRAADGVSHLRDSHGVGSGNRTLCLIAINSFDSKWTHDLVDSGARAVKRATCPGCKENAALKLAAAAREQEALTATLVGLDTTRTVAESLLRAGDAPVEVRLYDLIEGAERLASRAELVKADFLNPAAQAEAQRLARNCRDATGRIATVRTSIRKSA